MPACDYAVVANAMACIIFRGSMKTAMQGHAESRYNLGCIEEDKGNHDHRAVRHWLMFAKMVYENSAKNIKKSFMEGVAATRDQYAKALKGYQEAMAEMNSHAGMKP